MGKMGEAHAGIIERIEDAPTVAALAVLRYQLKQSERMTPEFDEAITRRMQFFQEEAAHDPESLPYYGQNPRP